MCVSVWLCHLLSQENLLTFEETVTRRIFGLSEGKAYWGESSENSLMSSFSISTCHKMLLGWSVMESDISWVCSTHFRMRTACTILAWGPYEVKSLGRTRCSWLERIEKKSHLRSCAWSYWLGIEYMGRDSVVGIASRYGLGGTGIESRWGPDLPAPGVIQPSTQWVPGLFSGGKAVGALRWPPTTSSAEVKEIVLLYIYCPCVCFYGKYSVNFISAWREYCGGLFLMR